ncbi:hypothetical protein [Streptomyces sp. PSAA01]|uniref:hypothetical protein n=1 Tax=Streptomyces sp. PSAA01 TaxID=2912762 RepID=UPI001F25C046|nr:hypothetical protein [Streptomyces sp. PSAA01]MCG0290575.1 hypothetical protein [Streptomyces sp. PSAA01]
MIGVQGLDLGVLGQRPALVRELRQPDVERLDVEEADLIGGRGIQRGAPGESSGTENEVREVTGSSGGN